MDPIGLCGRTLLEVDAAPIRFTLRGKTLQMTMLVTDGGWDDPGAHHETIDIDVHTAAAYVVKPIPFGVDDAVATAIKQWQFTPAATRTSGVIAFRFEIVRFPRR